MSAHAPYMLKIPNGSLQLGPDPIVMGILNVTPDSFSDGGDHVELDIAIRHARDMRDEGADILDVGGESTRPGGKELGVQDELDRVIPAVERLFNEMPNLPISIDTYKALVADQAVQAGASIINDVYGLQREPEIADVAALHGVPLIAMHWDTDRDSSKDIIAEMNRYFDKTLAIADKAGVASDQIVLDPGFGFAKTLADNYEILRRLDELKSFNLPLLSGTSRKSMIGRVIGHQPKERLAGTLATTTLAYCAGAHIFRVHDVRPNRDALAVAKATLYGPQEEI